MGVVSLTMGNSALPFADGFIRNIQAGGKLLLGHALLPAQLCQKTPKSDLVQFVHRFVLLVSQQFCLWLHCTGPDIPAQPTGGRIGAKQSFFLFQSAVHLHSIHDVGLLRRVVSGCPQRDQNVLLFVHHGKAGKAQATAIKYIGLLESPSPRKIDAMILYAVMHGTPIKQMIR